jgi:hypothetical protein
VEPVVQVTLGITNMLFSRHFDPFFSGAVFSLGINDIKIVLQGVLLLW